MTHPWERLTAREREVLGWVLLGRAPDDIADNLRIGRSSVQRHVKRALEKLRGEEAGKNAVPSPGPAPEGRFLSLAELVVFGRSLSARARRFQSPWSMIVVATQPGARQNLSAASSPLMLLRVSDRVAIDGDYIVAVLPDTPLAGAERLLNRLNTVLRARFPLFGAACAQANPDEPVRGVYDRVRRQAQHALLDAQARRATGMGLNSV